jgi:beta-glucosidase
MARRNEAQRSRERLLTSQESIPLRKSLDDAYRSSSDSDLDSADFLSTDPLYSTRDASSNNAATAYDTSARLAGLRRTFARRSRCLIITLVVLIIFWSILAAGGFWAYKKAPPNGQSPPWYPTPRGGTVSTWKESYAKAAKMVKKMTLIEKVNVTTGTGWQMGLAVGNTGPATGVGFPSLALQDGPLGLRFADNATAFPAGITVGATWNKELMYARGKAHGLEARLKGINVLLGPCVGPIGRMPAGGRNWEGFGADPYLQGIAAAETIKGIQEEGVMATIKHFLGNEQEHYRQSFEWGLPNAMSSNINDRALHEIYGWPFADAVKAGVASVMCSYQMVNNSYACGNSKLLNGILKDELGFQGFVQSDWLAQRSGVASALAGLDMSMPGDGLIWTNGDSLWGPHLTKAVLNSTLPISRLNDMVTRIVAAWYQLGQDDKTKYPGDGPNFSSWTNDKMGVISPGSPDKQEKVEVNKFINVQGKDEEAHSIIARQVAAEGTVLVKNEGKVLPLSRDGWNDGAEHTIKYRVGIFGEDASEGKGPNHCADRGCNQGTLGSGWGSGAVEFPYLVSPLAALRKAFNPEKVYVTDFPTNTPPMKKAPAILLDQDVCIVFVNADSGEGFLSSDGVRGDRNDLNLQKGGDLLVSQVADGCGGGKGSTIVVIHSVGPVVVEKWIQLQGVKAVIMANLPGQESGNAIADILFGDVNPSGKLPYTVGKSLEDYGEGGQILYYPNGNPPQQNFSEGLYIDYRYFDKYRIEPRYEFGFGLSYTEFEYSNLTITPTKGKSALPSARPKPHSPPNYDEKLPDASTAVVPAGFKRLKKYIYPYIENVKDIKTGTYPYPRGYSIEQEPSEAGGGEGGNPSLWDIHANVTVNITNTGSVAGKEVVQLYIQYPDSPPIDGELTSPPTIDFPVKVLRGFEKVDVAPGETKAVQLQLTRRDLSYWDVVRQNWFMQTHGKYLIWVGSSSRDLKLVGEY